MTLVLDQPVLEELRSELRGQVIGPADPDYEIARKVHNGMIDKRPAVIARCEGGATAVPSAEHLTSQGDSEGASLRVAVASAVPHVNGVMLT